MKNNQNGFTLIELLIVMLVFVVVLIISADAFKTIIAQSSKLVKSEESNIEGVIGLEMLRYDLQQGGYGLYTVPLTSAYTGQAANAPASSYNDATLTDPPRAFATGNNLAAGISDNASEAGNVIGVIAGSDYLSIRATSVGMSNASKKWTYLRLNGGAVEPNVWPSSKENLAGSDQVVVLRRALSASTNDRTLIRDTAGDFFHAYSNAAFVDYSTSYSRLAVYGLGNSGPAPLMPYNRSDYFVARPSAANKVPSVCAPNTGVLYKTVVNNSAGDGRLTYYPVLDCVADMQVVLGWDLYSGANQTPDGTLDTYSNADGTIVSGAASVADVQCALGITVGACQASSAATIRNSLKMIKVFVLAQNGKKDPTYTSPSPVHVGDQTVLSNTRGRNVDIAANGWSNYRWKLYQIVVRPKNLTGNQ